MTNSLSIVVTKHTWGKLGTLLGLKLSELQFHYSTTSSFTLFASFLFSVVHLSLIKKIHMDMWPLFFPIGISFPSEVPPNSPYFKKIHMDMWPLFLFVWFTCFGIKSLVITGYTSLVQVSSPSVCVVLKNVSVLI